MANIILDQKIGATAEELLVAHGVDPRWHDLEGCFYTSADAKKNTISVVSRWLRLIYMVATAK